MLTVLRSFWQFEIEAQPERHGNNAAMVNGERVGQAS